MESKLAILDVNIKSKEIWKILRFSNCFGIIEWFSFIHEHRYGWSSHAKTLCNLICKLFYFYINMLSLLNIQK